MIGEGPGQYLLFWENRQSFDGLKAQFDEELRAADPIERMWVDEIVDLEWDLHRLRSTRRTIVENGLVERLTQRVARIAAGTANLSGAELPTLAEIKYQALKCVGGDPASHQYIVGWLTHLDMEHEVRSVQADNAELLARLESSIHAASRLRETILNRLYSRRDLIADGRIRSGQGR